MGAVRIAGLVVVGCALGTGALLATRPEITPRSPVTHRVDMRGNSFVPRQLQIAVGDAVEFVNGNGGPHNVAFWPDSLPSGARDPLAMALPDSIGPLIGPLFIDPDQRWTVTFAGVPPGRYPYYCLPHLVGGMVAELVVVRPGTDR
jgi:plastocyanin